MGINSKQDGVYPRTPFALEQKYNYSKVFNSLTEVQLAFAKQDAEVKAELSLKLGRNENDQIVSMLNAAATEINISSERFRLTGDLVHWEDGELWTKTVHANESLSVDSSYNAFVAADDGVYIGLGIILRNEDPDGTFEHRGVIRCDEIFLPSLTEELGVEINNLKSKIAELEERIKTI